MKTNQQHLLIAPRKGLRLGGVRLRGGCAHLRAHSSQQRGSSAPRRAALYSALFRASDLLNVPLCSRAPRTFSSRLRSHKNQQTELRDTRPRQRGRNTHDPISFVTLSSHSEAHSTQTAAGRSPRTTRHGRATQPPTPRDVEHMLHGDQGAEASTRRGRMRGSVQRATRRLAGCSFRVRLHPTDQARAHSIQGAASLAGRDRGLPP